MRFPWLAISTAASTEWSPPPDIDEGSGTYQEVADEVFVGTYGSLEGSFEMTENYTAKLGADNVTGLYFARCQHPIKSGTGTGDFDGVTGRLDFKDDTDAGTAAYKGHLRFG